MDSPPKSVGPIIESQRGTLYAMAFTHAKFIMRFETLYHMTSPVNLPFIRETGCLKSAEQLMRLGGKEGLFPERRMVTVPLTVGGSPVRVRDQAHLYEEHIEFQGGWNMQRLLQELNRRVFFWADVGPYAINHLERYRHEEPPSVILRIPSYDLFHHYRLLPDANREPVPHFCIFNSGSPRTVNGRASPRGPTTFVTAPDALFSPGMVAEVTFQNEVVLPRSTRVATAYDDPGVPLFS